MKHLLHLIIFTTISITTQAADLLPGYIVMANNDTIKCQVKGGRFLNVPFNGVTIINEQGEQQSFGRDKKIIAFGFVEKIKKYHYLYIEPGNKSENGFYQRVVNGDKYKLYGRPTTVYGGNPTYVLFNAAGEFAFFETCILCPWKKKLRELLQDNPKALELVDDAPRINIPKFVLDIDRL